ncbi:MAG: lipopolysaccharide kinase InaA family protein [Syntrophomonas sp.]
MGLVLPNPYHFLKNEYSTRQSFSQPWYTGINHGDLNMQNILLDERDNVYIIDFSETRPRNIVSDFARLEPIFKFEMTRMGSEADLVSFLKLEKSLAEVNSLDEVPPFVYPGDDPAVKKVYQMICLIRKYAKTVVIFETDIIPYLLAMLEWTLPIVVFVNVSPFAKKAATYSAALIVEQIMRLESK